MAPIFGKGDRRKVENYRPVSLLNINSKILDKCINIALDNHFQNFLTKSQHGFVRRRSVQTNMLLFLKRIYEALDHDPQSEIIAFYTDFSKAFDKVPHYELIQKLIDVGVGRWLLEILIDYLSDRRQCESGQYQFEDTRYNKRGTPGVTHRLYTVLYIY